MQKGYTLIELLVVISIMALLSGVLILYSRISESQLTLFKEQAKLISTLLRAKALALQTYTKEGAPCAYGVRLEPDGNFFIFKDLDENGKSENCETADHSYSKKDVILEEKKMILDQGLQFEFESSAEKIDLVFIPPEPKVIINGNSTIREAAIKITTLDKKRTVAITVNNSGQVTTE